MVSRLNIVSCQETSKHAGNIYDLENGINDWCISPRIETYFCGGIDAFDEIVTNGGIIERTFWSNSCDVCCGNSFSGSSMIPGDYCCCCGDGRGYGGAQSPNNSKK